MTAAILALRVVRERRPELESALATLADDPEAAVCDAGRVPDERAREDVLHEPSATRPGVDAADLAR